MLQLSGLNHQIEDKSLLEDINWTINPKKRVALIGANGAGKTTLLRLISEELPLQNGTINKPKTYQIGYLPQEEINFGADSIIHEVLEAKQQIRNIEHEKEAIRSQLEYEGITSDEQKPLVDKMGQLEEQFNILGGYGYEAQAKKILMGLGFSESEFEDPINSKSGGWRMRVYLARLLLQEPDLLLLDEPTNHLDVESLEWLENYLSDFKGSMIIVSHDRYFIDRLADEIAELANHRLTHYAGNYAFYEKQKALNEEQALQKAEDIRAEKERLTQFINRFRYKASKAPQVQDRVKRLAKLDEIEIPKAVKKINFRILCPQKSYKDVCHLDDLGFCYTDQWVFQGLNLRLYRGEKAALVGPNGEGKTTLTKLISSQLSAQQGSVNIGEKVSIGYYAQHQIDTLNHQNSIVEEVSGVAAEMYRLQIRDVLGLFKFSSDDIHKQIGVLSGGEKARVSLAKILLSPVNFLLMDEPTNHLDLDSKVQLEKALKNYDGTLLLISHDRYFLDKLVSIVFELKNGKFRRFEGNYSDYLLKKVLEETKTEPERNEKKSGLRKDKRQKRLEAEARQKISQRRKSLQDQIAQIENQLEAQEEEKTVLESKMTDPNFYKNQSESSMAGKRYRELQLTIPDLYKEWEEKQQELENLLAELKLL